MPARSTSTPARACCKKCSKAANPLKLSCLKKGLGLVSDDSAIRAVCEEVLAESPNEVAAYKGGKVTLIGWFVGGVMKKMRGKADAAKARKILEELLQ